MNSKKQVAWDEDLESLDLCAGARFHSTADDSPDKNLLRAICESIEKSADRDDGSELFSQYLIVLSEPDQYL